MPKNSVTVDGICNRCWDKQVAAANRKRRNIQTNYQSAWIIALIIGLMLLAFLCEV
jgi:hypothetical protein